MEGIEKAWTYGSILGLLSVAALECDAVALVLQPLGGNQTLDLRGLGVWLLALTLWLYLSADNEFADLNTRKQNFVSAQISGSHSVPSCAFKGAR